MRQDILEKINKANLGMSSFQITHFILKNELTDYKILKQILLELRLRYNQLMDFDDDIEYKKIEIEEVNNKLKYCDDQFEKRKLELTKNKLVRQLNTLRESRQQIAHEVSVFEQYYDNLVQQYGEDKINHMVEEAENYEPEYWVNRFVRMAQFELVSTGRISNNLLESISTLDPQLQEVILYNALLGAKKTKAEMRALELTAIKKVEQNMISTEEDK